MTTTEAQPAPGTTTSPAPGRLVALDTARFLAIVGMVAAHVALLPIPGLSLLVDGPPSTMFAILGGASAVLATRGLVARSGRTAATLSLVARGLVLVAVGLLLDLAPGPVVVVLVPFGVTLILLAVLLPLRSRWLLVIATVLAVAGPIGNHALRQALQLRTMGELSFASPWAFTRSVLVTGTYPVVTWLVYALIGVVVIRAVLAAREQGTVRPLARRLTWWGLGASVVATGVSVVQVQLSVVPRMADLGLDTFVTHLVALSPSFGGPIGGGLDAVLTATPHSGTTGDIVRTGGLALAVVGLLLRRGLTDRPVRWPGRIVRAGGAAPLTIYVVHVLAYRLLWATPGAVSPDGSTVWWLTGVGGFGVQLGIVLAVSTVLVVVGRRGPLETGVSAVARTAARLAR
ncbi:MAG TPA: hypothetical protein VKY86_15470 [Promicromonospora sp.]|nr:hypothetical protein [Promicromonospora sp.]